MPDAGWYADPRVPKQLRWWDGDDWTNNVHVPDLAHARPSVDSFTAGQSDRADFTGA
jgi:hypothetical protein